MINTQEQFKLKHFYLFVLTYLFFSRLSILAQDMANVQSRVDDVNKAVKQLEDSRHARTKEVKDCQARLNKRYRHRSNIKMSAC